MALIQCNALKCRAARGLNNKQMQARLAWRELQRQAGIDALAQVLGTDELDQCITHPNLSNVEIGPLPVEGK